MAKRLRCSDADTYADLPTLPGIVGRQLHWVTPVLLSMSFGFSVGDFIAAGVIIKDIISALRTSSTSDHQELVLELHGLQRALDEIEHLQSGPQHETEVNAVKVTALTCQYRLDDFAGKLKKFESLGQGTKVGSSEKAKLWRLKLHGVLVWKQRYRACELI